MKTLLEVRNLTKIFGGLTAVSDVSFDVEQGEVVGLIGPNGAGKTTLFNMIAGLILPTSGQVFFDGQDCTKRVPHEMAELGVGRTFQITSLFPTLSTLENVRISMHRHTRSTALGALMKSKLYRQEEKEIQRKATDILEFLGMSDLAEFEAQYLSYGDQRKLELAIALATEAKLLLLDEPAAGMSPEESRRLIDLIGAIRKRGITVLLVEHHMKVVMGVCDRIVVINQGMKIAEGSPVSVANNPEVIRIYLGREAAHA